MSQALEEIEKLKHAPAYDGVDDNILRRWSPRAFADRAVTAEDLKKIFEAARWAASSYNEQPWRFLVGKRGDSVYPKIFDVLIEFNQSWAKSAPVLILSAAKKTFTQNSKPNDYYLHDLGAATAYLSLQATELGLHTHSMAGFDKTKARELLQIPADYDVGAVTALGYFGDPAILPDQARQMELAPRNRKSLDEIVFGEWGESLL